MEAGGEEEDALWARILAEENRQRVVDKLAKLTKRSDEDEEVWPPREGSRHSAVLIPMVTVKGEPSVLFTVRSQQLSNHRNQVSFPGGLCDGGDVSPEATALRETSEELGIPSCDVDVWGRLASLPDRRQTSKITPVLALVRNFSLHSLKLNPAEVQHAFTLPLRHLADPRNSRYTRSKYYPMRFPVYLGGSKRVWGLTAFMLDMALLHLLPRKLYTPISLR